MSPTEVCSESQSPMLASVPTAPHSVLLFLFSEYCYFSTSHFPWEAEASSFFNVPNTQPSAWCRMMLIKCLLNAWPSDKTTKLKCCELFIWLYIHPQCLISGAPSCPQQMCIHLETVSIAKFRFLFMELPFLRSSAVHHFSPKLQDPGTEVYH